MHHNITLPDFLLPFVIGSTNFESIYYKSYNGREFIKNPINEPRQKYKIINAILSEAQYLELYNFFVDRKGVTHSFLIYDKISNLLTKDNLILEISEKDQSSYKIIQKMNMTFKHIKYPILNSIKLYNNERTIDFTYNDSTCSITPLIEINEIGVLNITCEYYTKVRFSDNSINYSFTKEGGIKIENISLAEVIDV